LAQPVPVNHGLEFHGGSAFGTLGRGVRIRPQNGTYVLCKAAVGNYYDIGADDSTSPSVPPGLNTPSDQAWARNGWKPAWYFKV